jgi:hypothetical protein
MEIPPTHKKIEIELTKFEVDPELIQILTGSTDWNATNYEAGMTINTPIKRTFWQWLRRKPIQWSMTFIPAARVKFIPDGQ